MNLYQITDFIGIVAFALAGILAARGRKVDPVGVFVMAFTTAFGGGLIRDIIIDNRPFYWIAHQEYDWVVLFMTLIAPLIVRKFTETRLYAIFIWSDAIGLAVFSVGGTAMSTAAGVPALPAVILGVCTGVFGGLLRDVFLCRVPMVLSDKQPYAFAAFAGNWVYLGLVYINMSVDTAFIASAVFIAGLRLVCWHLDMPFVSYGSHKGVDDGTL